MVKVETSGKSIVEVSVEEVLLRQVIETSLKLNDTTCLLLDRMDNIGWNRAQEDIEDQIKAVNNALRMLATTGYVHPQGVHIAGVTAYNSPITLQRRDCGSADEVMKRARGLLQFLKEDCTKLVETADATLQQERGEGEGK